MNRSFLFIPTKLITSLFFLFFSFTLYSQDESVKEKEEVKVEKTAFAINDISEESEKASQHILDYQDILLPSGTIKEVDSLLNIAYVELKIKRDSLILELDGITRRDLKIRKVEWQNYKSSLKSYQKELNDRVKEVSDISNLIISEIETWNFTKEELKKNASSKNIFENLDKIITPLNEVLNTATVRLEAIYSTEKKLTELVLVSDELIALVKKVELDLKRDYFIFDSNPIWVVNDTIKQAGLEVEKKSFKDQFISNKKNVSEFFRNNSKTAITQVSFILFIFIMLLIIRRKWIVNLKDLTNPVEIQAIVILKNPLASTAIFGLLVSAFFYDELIPNVAEVIVSIIFLGMIRILPKLTNEKFRVYLILLFALYILNIFRTYLEFDSIGFRIILLISTIVMYFLIKNTRKLIVENPENFIRVKKVFMVIAPFYMMLLIVSSIANIIGMVGLSRFLFAGVLGSIILLFILYATVKIMTSFVVLLFKLRKKFELKTVTTIVDATHKRFQPILFWGGMIVWLIFTIKGFDVLDFIQAWVDKSLHISWIVGATTISLGGVLSFLTIFIVTILVAKLVASIFLDEWMVSILPRGAAPAISIMLRIFLISIGFYVGATSAGINLSQFGFIIGALGVGIGFGLQNIVLNFISGLILAFERPINIGDTIEVDSEFGIVTNIGVRSSNIRTYSGYEAIIPNGDLISKKVVNWTLSNRDRRSKIFLKTSPNANPEEVIALFNIIAAEHPNTFNDPAPKTYFKGYGEDGNLQYQLLYWSTFSDALRNDHEIALAIFKKLKEEGIEAPAPVRRIVKEN